MAVSEGFVAIVEGISLNLKHTAVLAVSATQPAFKKMLAAHLQEAVTQQPIGIEWSEEDRKQLADARRALDTLGIRDDDIFAFLSDAFGLILECRLTLDSGVTPMRSPDWPRVRWPN